MTAAVIILMLLSMDNMFDLTVFVSILYTLEDSDCVGNNKIIE